MLREYARGGGPRVIHLHGVSGIGKSALIRTFADGERASGRKACLLDGRAIEPSERGFLNELALGLRVARPTLPAVSRALSATRGAILIILDSYEVLGLLDAWLRQVFMARLGNNVRLILVSRFAPAPQWTEAPEWRGKFRAMQLQPISESAALQLLATLGTDSSTARALSRFAHGHPLALVIGGAAASQLPPGGERTPHAAISALARRFLSDVDDPRLREALRAASLARRITRSLLRALTPGLAQEEDLFDRVAAVPFVEAASDGLMIHDAAREALRADLEAIDPRAFHRYRRAAWQQLVHEAKLAAVSDLWRYTADLIFLINNPVVREAFFPRDLGEFYAERASAADAQAIAEIAAAHDGETAAGIIERWRRHLPKAFYVIRDARRQVAGFYCLFDPQDAAPALLDNDPVASTWIRHLRKNPLPNGRTALFLRRWLSRRDGEAPSAVQATAWLDIKRHYMERRPLLQRVYVGMTNVPPYAAVAEGLGIRVIDEPPAAVGDISVSSLALDMGPRSVDGWLARLAAAEIGAEDDGLLDERRRALVLNGHATELTRKEFEVMRYLTLRQGEAVTRIELLNDVWGIRHGGGNVVDVIVASLRKKLGTSAGVIETVHGHGYLYRSPGLAAENDRSATAATPKTNRTPDRIRSRRRVGSEIQ